jgi:hypothetical protein
MTAPTVYFMNEGIGRRVDPFTLLVILAESLTHESLSIVFLIDGEILEAGGDVFMSV